MDYAWFLFGFKGRINRAKCWLAMLIILCWMLFLAALIVGIGSLFGGPRSIQLQHRRHLRLVDPAAYRVAVVGPPVPTILSTSIGTPLFAVGLSRHLVKRLHDRNKSGWWMLPFFVLPGLYNQFGDRLAEFLPMSAARLAAFALHLWGFVELVLPARARADQPVRPRPAAASRGPLRIGHALRSAGTSRARLEFVPHRAGPPPAVHVKRGA